jgi:hypothetical protein
MTTSAHIKEDISRAVDVYLESISSRHMPYDLLRMLHCPYRDNGSGILFDPVAEDSPEWCDITSGIRKLLGSFIDVKNRNGNASILFGAMYYNCLPDYRHDVNAAYAVSTAILFYLEDYMPGNPVDTYVESRILALLDDWLKPATAWAGRPDLSEVCRRFFGAAWCALALPADVDEKSISGVYRNRGFSVEQLVAKQRPPFMPGLCTQQDVGTAAKLPSCLGDA